MFIPGSIPTNTNLPITTMNNNLHQQQFLFDNLKDHRSNKLLSPMSRKTSATPNFLLDPEILRELNARYLHDINSTRTPSGNPNPNFDTNGIPALLLPPFLRAEHYHQHTHTHEHNLNILTPTNNSLSNGNTLLDKLSKSDNSLSPFLRTTAANNFSLPAPPPPIFPPFSLINNPTSSPINTKTKETDSSSAKKSSKWCAAHVRISWMIYHQQQRSKDKSSTDNKKDDEQHALSNNNNKLPDLVSNSKPIFPPPMSTNNELSLPLPSTFQSSVLPPAAFNYRSPFDFGNVNNGPFGRLAPSSNTAFGGLGSLFPPPPPPPPPPLSSSSSSSIDRKPDLNGSVAAAAALGLDWSRFHRGIVGPSPLVPPSANNDNLLGKKHDEINNNNNSNNDKKRSSSVLNNVDDDRRNSHHHLMHPPSSSSHGTNSTNYSSNRSRSRSPHRPIHQHHSSSSLLNKTSSSLNSSPPSHSSSSRKRSSPHMKSDNSKSSSHPPSPLIPLPPTFGGLDPLTLSIIERQRLSAAYASLIANASQPNNFYPTNIESTMYRPNGTSNLFPNVDSSAMTAALMQREHFLNSLRQQQELIERERAAVASMTKNSSKSSIINQQKIEQITSPKLSTDDSLKRSPKSAISPSSHSSTSNSSSTSSSKKVKHVKREQDSSSPSATVPSTKENIELTPKEETPIATS